MKLNEQEYILNNVCDVNGVFSHKVALCGWLGLMYCCSWCRELLPNGSLYFPPFPAEDYNPELHSATYRCRATNPAGSIISRDCKLRAGQINWCTLCSISIQQFCEFTHSALILHPSVLFCVLFCQFLPVNYPKSYIWRLPVTTCISVHINSSEHCRTPSLTSPKTQ